MSVRVLAPAKVNLYLEVLARRADGYHELETLLLAVDLCDRVEVELEPAEAGEPLLRMELSGEQASPDVPRDGRNLAWRAAEIAQARARTLGRSAAGQRLVLRLEKRIPSAAGLGGGSSDAAAALLAACTLWGLDARERPLREGLAALGADCAFFLEASESGLAVGRGRGERIEPLPLGPAPSSGCVIGILVPSCVCATAEVYAELDPPRAPRSLSTQLLASLRDARAQSSSAHLFNRLEEAALRRSTELSAWRKLLDECDASSFLLSGSGSSFYSLFADEEQARGVLEDLATRAKARDLGLRGEFVTRPMESGARLDD